MKNLIYVSCARGGSKRDVSVYTYQTVEKQVKVQDVPLNEVVYLDMSVAHELVNNLAGKVLTIVDAVLPDEKQCKAVKDLIRNEVMNSHIHIGEISIPNMKLEDWVDEEDLENVDGTVSMEEIIGA